MTKLERVLSLDDFEPLARRKLPRPIFGYIAGASEGNASLAANRSAFSGYAFIPRALVDVAQRSASVKLFGTTYQSPFGLAPMGLSALSAYRGDIVLASAAKRESVPMIMSGSSLIRLEEVAAINPDAWFQAYLPGENDKIQALIARVAAAGFRTLVITIDTPVAANRENNIRTGFSTPLRPSARLAWDGLTHPSWLFGTFLRTMARHGMPHFENNYAERGAPILSSNVLRDFSDRGHLNWDHLKKIRSQWKGPLVIKGILHRDDARKAVSIGADGIIVSNHGGRQLDGSVSPLHVLPEIVDAVPSTPVMLDSGVRRGTDVIKAIALGAQMAFVGRPFGYAAAVAGEAGVRHGIKILGDEILRNMGLLGVTSVSGITRETLFPHDTARNIAVPMSIARHVSNMTREDSVVERHG
jgi:L-lactate dehydrogenase (cytochrome)